jgi:isopenicillin N synthase-like dioxygenase
MLKRAVFSQGVVHTYYEPQVQRAVAETIEKWKAFCQLPYEVRSQVGYSCDINVSGVGYECKLQLGKALDVKEDFHVRLSERAWLDTNMLPAGKVGQDFLDSCYDLNALVAPHVLDYAHMATEAYGLSGFVHDTEVYLDRMLFRFLHYFGSKAYGGRKHGDIMAAPHVDKGCFTLHLHESAPGLERLTYDTKEWTPMDVGLGETIILPGMRMQLRTENELRAVCHRVVATAETAEVGRISAVCFVDCAGTPYFNKSEKGNTQGFSPGFNYEMPLEEFSKLFVAA